MLATHFFSKAPPMTDQPHPDSAHEERRFSLSATIDDLEAADEVSLFEAPFGHLALCREAASWLRDLSTK